MYLSCLLVPKKQSKGFYLLYSTSAFLFVIFCCLSFYGNRVYIPGSFVMELFLNNQQKEVYEDLRSFYHANVTNNMSRVFFFFYQQLNLKRAETELYHIDTKLYIASLIAILITEACITTQQWNRPQITHCVSGTVTAQRKGGGQNILENRFIAGACIGKRMTYTLKRTTVPLQYDNLLLDIFFYIGPLYS